MKKRAFTLAELLISMAIIGVLSALLVPVMMNWQKKALETQTVHFYAMMSNAIKQYMIDNDTESLCTTKMYYNNEWNYYANQDEYSDAESRANAEVDKFVHDYLNVREVCNITQYGEENKCFSKTINNINEYAGNMIYVANRMYILANGAVFSLTPSTKRHPMSLQVDINGQKGPNIAGRDIWFMHIYRDGVISEQLHGAELKNKGNPDADIESIKSEVVTRLFNNNCNFGPGAGDWMYGIGCFARFENNGFKFDY